MPMETIDVSITTTSQVMSYNSLPPAQVPKIMFNGQPVGQLPYTPNMPTGWQILILDPTKDLTTPAAILGNAFLLLFPAQGSNYWMTTYHYMYSGMLRESLISGNYEQQILIAASFGLDANTPPTNDGMNLLLDFGAGPQLQKWETSVDVGSQVGNDNSWTSFPANYIFVGSSSLGYGQGAEIYQGPGSGNSVETTLTTTLTNFVAETG